MEEKGQKHRHRRRRRLEDSGKKNPFTKIESLISKYLLRVIGIIFVLASIFFAANSAGKLLNLIKGIQGKTNVVQPVAGAAGVSALAPSPGQAGEMITGMMVLWVAVIAALILLVFFIANRTRRKEIGRLSLLLFYAGITLLALRQGWQTHLLFPLALFFSLLLFINGKRIRTTFACKINLLMAWMFFGIWWGLKILLGGNLSLLFPCFLYSAIFFLFFLFTGIAGGFSGYHKSSKYTEIIVISINIAAYYLVTALSLYKSGSLGILWLFTLLLAVLLFIAIYVSDHMKREFNKTPYLFAGMILLSLVMPLLFRVEILLLFFGCLSALLLVYARFSGEQAAVIGSMVGLVIMLLVFLQEWILHFFPAVFLRNIMDDQQLVYKGILAGLVAVPVLIIDHLLLKEADVSFSRKWFTRRSYLRLMKFALLVVIYLTGYWIFTWSAMMITKQEEARYLFWFCFSSLYFIIVLPVLAKQKSTFLRPFVWLSAGVMISYPLFIHLTVVVMRNTFLKHSSYSSAGFAFHYLAIFLLLIGLWITGVHYVRIYRSSKPFLHGLWTFIILMLIFLFLSEMDHTRIVTGLKRGVRIEDLVASGRQLPYTIVLLTFSMLTLAIGFLRRNRFLRALSLVIFAFTLVKFLYLDIRSVDSTGRTILLFSAGVAVLTLSFFYRRIRTFFHYRESGGKPHHHHHHHHSRVAKDEMNGGTLPENSVNKNETL